MSTPGAIRAGTVCLALLAACGAPSPAVSVAGARAAGAPPPVARPTTDLAPPSRDALVDSPQASPQAVEPPLCAASLAASADRDAREPADLSRCRFAPTGEEAAALRCGLDGAAAPLSAVLDRLDEAVPSLPSATRARVAAIAARGQQLGRRRGAVGLLGDSITASPKFLRPFSGPGAAPELPDEVQRRLAVSGHGTVVDFYRGLFVEPGRDSFRATRAAKVGATSGWAMPAVIAPHATPVGQLVAQLSPAVVVLGFGSNDAAVRSLELGEMTEGFERRMGRILDYLEERGVVPVLSTVPRHTDDPARAACDRAEGDLSDWRMAVQTSRLSAAVARLACARDLPLIDLRHALDAAQNHGIGGDGVHPTSYRGGAGVLTAAALQCGYNVRNYVTLRMLAQLVPLLPDS